LDVCRRDTHAEAEAGAAHAELRPAEALRPACLLLCSPLLCSPDALLEAVATEAATAGILHDEALWLCAARCSGGVSTGCDL
jgi:hypothetical protein